MKALTFDARAEADLRRVYLESCARHNVATAETYLTGLLAVCARLPVLSGMGRPCKNERVLPHGVHLIFYVETADTVVITHIRHQRRKPR